jgi:Molybdopterin oxidoreductase
VFRDAKVRNNCDPVAAWAEIVATPELRQRYVSARGNGGFVRASWDQALEIAAAAQVHTISDWGPDRMAGLSPIPAMSMVAIVSIPGEYVAAEVERLLNHDLHVVIFSDNVSIDHEVALKRKARERGLLVMGPDCGTGSIGALPLAFTDAVQPGNIGLVGASGTGLQEVMAQIDGLGEGLLRTTKGSSWSPVSSSYTSAPLSWPTVFGSSSRSESRMCEQVAVTADGRCTDVGRVRPAEQGQQKNRSRTPPGESTPN